MAEGADVDVAYTDGKNNEMTTLINECVRRENETLYTVENMEVGCLQFLLDSGANVDFALVSYKTFFYTYNLLYHHNVELLITAVVLRAIVV